MKFLAFGLLCVFVVMASGHRLHRRHIPQHDSNSKTKYEYKYGVQDLDSGDIKQQWEYRDGNRVNGGYSFKESDGFIRVVEYSVDDASGFKAVVRRIDPSHYPDTQRNNHHEHIAFSGNHVQHDAKGRGKSYINVLTSQ